VKLFIWKSVILRMHLSRQRSKALHVTVEQRNIFELIQNEFAFDQLLRMFLAGEHVLEHFLGLHSAQRTRNEAKDGSIAT